MTKRDRLMLLGVLALAVLGGFWMFVLSPQRKAATEAEARVQTAQSSLATAQQQLVAGRKAQQAFRRDRTTIVKLGRVVPESDDIPTLLTQLQALAKKEKVTFTSYAIDSAGATASAASSASSTSTESTDDTNAVGSQTGSGSTAVVAPLYPPGSVKIEGGLGRTPIALELEGTYFQLERYLRAVQRFAVLSQNSSRTKGRLMIVDGFGFTGASEETDDSQSAEEKIRQTWSKAPKLTATLSASVYFAPPLDAPKTSGAGSSAAATPAAGATSSGSTTTGTAAIGGLR